MPTKSSNFKILLMVTTDFLDYRKAATSLFSKIPYKKIKQIVYNKNTILKVNFRTSLNEDFNCVRIGYTLQAKSFRTLGFCLIF